MRCPICKTDHFMICHSCPHNGMLAGLDYASSPCAVCGVDRHGKKRRNDSREGGHGRVVSLEQIERYLSDELPEEDVGTEEEQPREKEAVLDFIGVFCRMGILQQFLVEQRFFFGRPLEKIAADYRQRFRRPMTAAGVSVAVAAAKARIAPGPPAQTRP